MTNSARLCLLVSAMMAAVSAPACAAPPVLTATVIQTGLSRPWDVAFLPDGRMLVSERRGNILIFQSPDPGASLLATIPLEGVHAESEAGAMGIAIDPGFATNGFLYLCISRDDELEWRNQVLRYVVSENTLTFDSFVIRRGILASFNHNGCRVRFGPDGKLWVTSGDASDPPSAQNPNSLNGKVLRVNPDGTVPDDNPILPGAISPTAAYTMGHRNPQGIAFDPFTRLGFSMEHAHHRISETAEEHDTINVLRAAANYGWPEVAGSGSGFDQPAWGSGVDRRLAISGGAIVSGGAWGEWSGHLFAAALAGQRLLHFGVDGETVTELPTLYEGAWGRLRSPVLGPDGSLYLTTDIGDGQDLIIRITPAGPEGSAPVRVNAVAPETQPAGAALARVA
jgi:glucose/arabinose dehydrogenase